MSTAAPQSTLAGPEICYQTLDRELSIETLTKPTVRGVLLTGLPGFLREGFLPLGAFYVGLRLSGLGVGIAASVAVSVLVYLYERRAGRDALVVRLSLAFVALQSAVGLAAHSAVVYLAQPVLANAVWGFAFLISAAGRRPLAGALACAWYPFPAWFRQQNSSSASMEWSRSSGASTCSYAARFGSRCCS